jgi:lipopolysaccharide biosynthesis glycosyltransferase
MKPLKIFIGFDSKETVAFHTLAQSILSRATQPIALVPVNLLNLTQYYLRPFDARQSNSFSFSRFLVPYLCDFQGYALFMDCDMLVRCDIAELFEKIDASKAVSLVKHDYKSRVDEKYLGTKQYNYPRKNWSSLVLWNCEHEKNKVVTPEFIANQDAATLHRFLWLDEDDIGGLSVAWNWLVGEYENPTDDVKIVHWTLGGPYFNEYRNVDFADEWNKLKEAINYCQQRF